MTIAALRARWKPSSVPHVKQWQSDRTALTKQQANVLWFILDRWLKGHLPTYRDIAGYVADSQNVNVGHGHVRALQRKGYLKIHNRTGYQLTDKALDLVL